MARDGNKPMRTALKKSVGLGSARDGTHDYRMVFVTALLNIPLYVIFIFLMMALVPQDFMHARMIVANPVVATFFISLLICGIYNMYLHMREILEDYIACHYLRSLAVTANIVVCFVVAVLSILAVVKIAVGA